MISSWKGRSSAGHRGVEQRAGFSRAQHSGVEWFSGRELVARMSR